jgi:hypothetical protein
MNGFPKAGQEVEDRLRDRVIGNLYIAVTTGQPVPGFTLPIEFGNANTGQPCDISAKEQYLAVVGIGYAAIVAGIENNSPLVMPGHIHHGLVTCYF